VHLPQLSKAEFGVTSFNKIVDDEQRDEADWKKVSESQSHLQAVLTVTVML
jgi:hypothetical protein